MHIHLDSPPHENNLLHFLPESVILDKVQTEVLGTLHSYANALHNRKSFLGLWRSKLPKKGVYIYGGVGRGKTMVTNAFYNALNIDKNLVHYQSFVQQIHQKLHILQRKHSYNIVPKLAKDLASDVKVLCLDEFEIKDITDAMLIGRLFDELIRRGVFIVVTSNSEPSNLYKDGLQREAFLPFIAMLNKEFAVLKLDNQHDYRMDKLSVMNERILYPTAATAGTDIANQITQVKHDLTDGQALYPQELEVFGRKLIFSRSYKNVLITDFNELFLQEFGYSDYVNICQYFSVIVLENVPVIDSANSDVATRFINFIDNAYFYKVLLFLTLQALPEDIYKEGRRAEEFKRTISRLYEMNSADYLKAFYDE